MTSILFVTLHKRNSKALKYSFHDVPCVECLIKDIRDLDTSPGTMFMSPANSHGYMDNGIDAAYMSMFSGVQKAVQDKLKKLGHVTSKNRCAFKVSSSCSHFVTFFL